jgi:prepilin-type N-terminal cleavage/methylation domain-containing protein
MSFPCSSVTPQRPPRREAPRPRAFTLVELLLVIGILALLLSLLITGLRGTREAARSTVCLSNLRQAGLLTEVIADQRDGLLPFWLSNTPALPLLGRSDQRTVYGPHTDSWECFVCPADRRARSDDDWRDGRYTSYEYYPGEWMNRLAEEGQPDPVRAVTVLFRREPAATVFYDRSRNWHPGGRQQVYLPDMHAK